MFFVDNSWSYLTWRWKWDETSPVSVFFPFISMQKMFLFVSSLFSDKIFTGWIHKVYAVWSHMDESKSFCWHRVIGSLTLRDFYTILKLTILETRIEKAVLLSVCGTETFSSLKDLITPDSLRDKMFDELSQALEEHSNPAPSIIVKWFNFYVC